MVVRRRPSFFKQFQLVHFTCSYAPRKWLAVLRGKLPCVTSHHRVSDWELMKHNADGDVVVVASRQWAEDLVLRGVPSDRIIRLAYGVDREAFSFLTEIARRHISEKVFSACVGPQGRRVGSTVCTAASLYSRRSRCCRRRSIVLARRSDSSRRPRRDSRFGEPILSRLTFATACAAERFSFHA